MVVLRTHVTNFFQIPNDYNSIDLIFETEGDTLAQTFQIGTRQLFRWFPQSVPPRVNLLQPSFERYLNAHLIERVNHGNYRKK
jgi:hypothetical protein